VFNRLTSIVPLSTLFFLTLIAPWARSDDSISFKHDVQPILSRSCAGCHRPEKMKGKLDLTTFPGILHGGKNGSAIVAGDVDKSLLVQQVSGDDPEMPEKGEKLSAAEVGILTRWVTQGAKDDSASEPAAPSADASTPLYPKVYSLAPVISAIAVSPDGTKLAVAGSHEVLLHHADGSGLVARLPSRSPRITSIRFTPDGGQLLAAGGSAGEFGELDIYNVSSNSLLKSLRISSDTLFGLSLSPTGDRAAVGCADKTIRIIRLSDGLELDRFTQHTDWVLGTCFNLDGQRVVAAGRDKALWIVDLATHRPFDLVNDLVDPLLCVARDPNKDIVAAGMPTGSVRLFRLLNLIKTTERDRDPNRVKEIERQPGPANAIVYSADGKYFAVASTGEARVYLAEGFKRLSMCQGNRGGVYAIAFSPDGKQLYTAGFDGQVRIFGTEKGKLIKSFVPVPLHEAPAAAASK
jgi:WD40 repeat protein